MAKDSQPLFSGVKIEIPQDRYKADLELHDRFQNFSGELLRLSLAGIAGVGVFLTVLTREKPNVDLVNTITNPPFFCLVATSLVFFGFSVAFALLHRFFASDGMYHHLRAIKLLILLEQQRAASPQSFEWLTSKAASDEGYRNRKFMRSERFLRASGALLFLGACCLGTAFMFLLKS